MEPQLKTQISGAGWIAAESSVLRPLGNCKTITIPKARKQTCNLTSDPTAHRVLGDLAFSYPSDL